MLCVHAGAKRADLNEIAQVLTPMGTDTHKPQSHINVINLVKSELGDYTIISEEYALSTQTKGIDYGARMFGVLKVQHANDYAVAIGIRNSHDKAFAFGMAIGASVFVCDNLSFHGDHESQRRHTRQIEFDLPDIIGGMVGNIPALISYQDEEFERLKQRELARQEAYDFVVRAAEKGVVTSDKILKVVKEYNEPQHPEFKDNTLWSLTNAFTEVMKGSNIFNLANCTAKLYKLAGEM